MSERLSDRERQIAAYLAVGLRVAGVARELCVSEHTVRNHLKSAFSKLDAHRQSDLVDLVRSDPSIVAPYDTIVGRAARTGQDMVAGALEVDRATEGRVEAAANSGTGFERMRSILHAVLPLDEARRAEWRVRLETLARSAEQPAVQDAARALHRKWAEKPLQRIEEFQARGWLVPDIPAEVVHQRIASAVYASALALLADGSPEQERRQLAAIDQLLAELTMSEARMVGTQPAEDSK